MDAFHCAICTEVMADAVTLPCGHEFCDGCIAQHRGMPGERNCPICRQPIPSTYTSIPAYKTRSLIKGLRVRCRFSSPQGCPFEDALQRIEAHEAACPLRVEPCALCCKPEALASMQDHMASRCERRLVACGDCAAKVAFAEQWQHSTVCPEKVVTCPNGCSGVRITRRGLSSHLSSWCSLQLVACSLKPLGCTLKVPRRDMHEHCNSFASHSHLLTTMKTSMASLEQQVQQLQKKLLALEAPCKPATPLNREKSWRLFLGDVAHTFFVEEKDNHAVSSALLERVKRGWSELQLVEAMPMEEWLRLFLTSPEMPQVYFERFTQRCSTISMPVEVRKLITAVAAHFTADSSIVDTPLGDYISARKDKLTVAEGGDVSGAAAFLLYTVLYWADAEFRPGHRPAPSPSQRLPFPSRF